MIKKTVEDYVNLDEFEILSGFIGACKTLTVRCKKHNQIFTTSANNVFRGCDKCKYEHHYKWKKDWRHVGQDEIIKRCKAIHPEYDYSMVNYINATTPIDIICPKHGKFSITYANFTLKTRPQGCKQCGIEKRSKSRQIDRTKYIKGIKSQFPYDSLDFTKMINDPNYRGVRYPTIFTCKIHGDWIMSINSAFWTKRTYLCEKCNKANKKYSLFAKSVYTMLIQNNINFEPEQSFPDWLRYRNPLLLDFYIPELKLAIEVHGGQHFCFCSKFHKDINDFELLQYKDKLKYDLCKQHNIDIIYFANAKDIQNIDSYHNIICTNLDELKNYILNLI